MAKGVEVKVRQGTMGRATERALIVSERVQEDMRIKS